MNSNNVIRFKTKTLPISKIDGKQRYSAVIQCNGPKSIEQTAKDMVKFGLSVDEMTAAHVLNFFAKHLPEMMAEDGGCRRSLGDLVTLYPIIDGSFDAPDGSFNAARNTLRVIATPPMAMRTGLDGCSFINITKAASGRITGLTDLGTKMTDGTFVRGDTVEIIGTGLTIIEDQAGEGVWLVPKAGGDAVKLALAFSGELLLKVLVPADLAAGAYTLRVCTRSGRTAEMALQTFEKDVNVVFKASGADIASVVDTTTNERDVLTGKDKLRVSGQNLMITASAADEGVWLEQTDGTKVGANLTVEEDGLDSLLVALVEPPAAGSYNLVVATRGGGDASSTALATLKHAITAK